MAEMGCRIVYSCSRLTAELRLSSNWQGCFADFEVGCLIMASTYESNYHGLENMPVCSTKRETNTCMYE